MCGSYREPGLSRNAVFTNDLRRSITSLNRGLSECAAASRHIVRSGRIQYSDQVTAVRPFISEFEILNFVQQEYFFVRLS